MKKVPPSGLLPKVVSRLREKNAPVLLVFFILSFFFLLTKLGQNSQKNLKLVKVLGVKENLLRGQVLKEGDLLSLSFVEGYVPQNALPLSEKEAWLGKTVLTVLLKGDIVTPHSLGANLQEPPFEVSKILKEGQAAFYLKRQDLVTAPVGLELNDKIDLFAFKKETGTLEKILTQASVIDLRFSTLSEMGSLEFIGLALSEAEIKKLTQVQAEGWLLTVAILPSEK